MSTPPSLQDDEPVRGLRERVRALSRAQRELIVFGTALVFGVLLMPLLIWMGGNRVLGPYTHGQNPHAGPFALLGDFLIGLGTARRSSGRWHSGRPYSSCWCGSSGAGCAPFPRRTP